MATLSRDEHISLIRLGQIASANGDLVRLLAVGGTIMVLELKTRESTKDVDALVINDLNRSRFNKYVAEVASERDWPAD